MGKMCVWLEKVLNWVDRCGLPAIPYIGKALFGYRSPPAPYLEIVYVLDKGYKDIAIGNRVVSIPPYHVALHNVHQGNFTPTMQRSTSWPVLLDVGGEAAFAKLEYEPLFCLAPLPLNEEVIAAYERLGGLCVRYGANHLYDAPGVFFYPNMVRSASPVAVMRIKAALLELLALLLDLLGAEEKAPSLPLPVQRAIEFVSLHYRNPDLRLPDISKEAGVSIHHFGRIFRQHMDESPMHYLKTLRMHHARYLLSNTDLRIVEIAADVGIPDPLHFSCIFRSLTGMSPRAWRNRPN